MKLNEGAFFAILSVGVIILSLSSISLDYWSANQVRVTYQTAYQKNMECRIASQKSGFISSVDRVCGKIPTLEDYQK
jgi:hypothetical protein